MWLRQLFTIGILIFMIGFSTYAQDVHFSQPDMNPLYINAALGGHYNGDWRAGITVREQWRSIEKPYQSYSAFYDKKFYYFSHMINAGLIFIHDRSGNAQLSSEKVYLNLSYPIKRGNSMISIGFQPGIVYRHYTDNLTFPEQYDNSIGYFNTDLSNNETSNYGNTQRLYADLNAGLSWTLFLPKWRPTVGFSLLHINQPNASFNQNADALGIRQNIHADARVTLSSDVYLRPAVYFSRLKNAHEFLLGMDAGKSFDNSNSPIREIFAGIYFRNGYLRNTDAATPRIGLQYQHWRIGMSYDITISELNEANSNRGAFELSLIYIAPNSKPKHSTIPCERF